MKISKNGNTSITGGLDGLPDALKMQVEETMKSLSSASGYPDGAVDNGDSSGGHSDHPARSDVVLILLIPYSI